MSDFRQRLDEILGMGVNPDIEETQQAMEPPPTYEIVTYEPKQSAITDVSTDKAQDYVHARSVIYGLLERGTTALEQAMQVAYESQHPRAYEVVSTIMRNVGELSKDLLKIQEAIDDSKGKQQADTGPKVQNNKQTNIYMPEGTKLSDILDALENDD